MKDIKNVVIYGAGLMGINMAFVFTKDPKYTVGICSKSEKDIKSILKTNTRKLVENGVISEEEQEERINRIEFTLDIDSDMIKNADLIIESVYEDPDIKRKVFADLEARVAEDTILGSNSSVIGPTILSRDLKHKNRFVNIHFWNPSHLLPLVEIVKSEYTDDEIAKQVFDILTELGKKPVICEKDAPGFIGNRLQTAVWREAVYIVEEGIASPEMVDIAVRNGFGLRYPQIGPMENIDLIGVDLEYNIQKNVVEYLYNRPEPNDSLSKLKEENKLGFKTLEGYQKWTKEQTEESVQALNDYLIKTVYKDEIEKNKNK